MEQVKPRKRDSDRKNESKRGDGENERNRECHRSRYHGERTIDDRKYSDRDYRYKVRERGRDRSQQGYYYEDKDRSREKAKRREIERDDDDRRRRKMCDDQRERECDQGWFQRYRDDSCVGKRRKYEGKEFDNNYGNTPKNDLVEEKLEKRKKRVQEWQVLKQNEEESQEGIMGKGKCDEGMDIDIKEGRIQEEDCEEEHRKLEEQVERRRRRVQEWQELQRKKTETEDTKLSEEECKFSKNWTLDDEEVDDTDTIMESSGESPKRECANAEDDIDPLDAFMSSIVLPKVEKMNDEYLNTVVESRPEHNLGRIIPGDDCDSDYGDFEDDGGITFKVEDDNEFIKRVKKTKIEKLGIVDHLKIQYPSFRKKLYVEVKDIARMTSEEVSTFRKQLDLKIYGKDVPKPIKTWIQTGLTTRVLDMIKQLAYENPMPIQAQALPIIMSGRDCIGVANTGSGKTLAFVLPMLRHIKDQPPLMAGDGPIALIMAPTRELVLQIHSVVRKFAKLMGFNCVAVYGGSSIAQQIGDLKRGPEIVVCAPARMLDILTKGSGKTTNLRRVTYLVMDEADRMFDMGFEEQITPIIQNIRPDRQTVLFSATFPRQVEIHARKVLSNPVQIQAGGRSVVSKEITQFVEVRPESNKFMRLLEILGEWHEKGKILIFVRTQDKCDSLFGDLYKSNYICLSLHGGRTQDDRESSISSFKKNGSSVMVATSIAARGLDVQDLELVVNYDAPNHYEDYVHRVGRSGRAGRKGCAITFISDDDGRYAPDLVKALELSGQAVPEDLKALADGFMVKVSQGIEKLHGSGYGGSTFKFSEEEDEAIKAAKKSLMREYGFEEDISDTDSENEGIRKIESTNSKIGVPTHGVKSTTDILKERAIKKVEGFTKATADNMPEFYQEEFELNDLPENARWKLLHKDIRGEISDLFGVAITPKGQYYPPGKNPGTGERKLYLVIEGPTEASVKQGKAQVKDVLEGTTKQSSVSGKFSKL
ncbi:RNA helicase [Ranunculus cassubicifolius]